MPLVYACIAPHAGDLIPETAPDPKIVAHTRATLQGMGEDLQARAPEVVVIINPHGFRVQNAISVAIADRATAEWSADVKLAFDVDLPLARAIADEAEAASLPVVRYLYGASSGPECFVPLDWGAVVPLYFLAHRLEPRPRIVHMSPMRLLPYQTHYDFGRALGRVLKASEQRVALVASADQGHTHNVSGPYGFDPTAARFDEWMQGVIGRGALDELLRADPDLVEHGKPDSLWPSLMLAGALKENPMRSQLLSYEVNVYFGILCAQFLPR